jgi:hypothetical protein
MMVTFAYLAMKEHLIASNFFREKERQVTTAIPYVCMWVVLIPNEYIFVAYQIPMYVG